MFPVRRRRPQRINALLLVEQLEARLAPASTRFGIIGDYGVAGVPEDNVASLVKGWNPDFIITVGDNNYPVGSAASIDANIGQFYHDYIGNYKGSYGAGSAVNRFFPALGNHDWETRTGTPALPTPYLNYFTLPGNERYYTFTNGPVQLFAIDSGDGSGTDSDSFDPDGYTSNSVQAQWLHNQLAASTATWKIVYFHHSPFSSGDHGNNTLMQWPFQAWGATAVITGHDHDYERLNVGGFPYFVNGLGGYSTESLGAPVTGSQVRYSGDFGAMRVDADTNGIQFQFIARTGAVIDSYTIGASPSPVVTISAADATAAEPGTDTGKFIISRSGSTTAALTVNVAITGTATKGVDYSNIATQITIPIGSATAPLQITPLDDSLVEASESVVATLSAGTGYQIGSANTATVTILDNDGASNTTLISAGSVWKYLANGTDQGAAWRATSFNDTAWPSGAAQLGYGDGDEATVVSYGPDANNKYITTYFRKSFTVTNAAAVTALNMRLIRDDGVVVYLNGTEVFRNNITSSAINYLTPASSALGGPDESTWLPANINPSLLVNGTNVIAVEIHQDNGASSDISFDFELTAAMNTTSLPAPPSTPDLVAASDTGVSNSDNITRNNALTFTGTAPANTTVRIYSDGVLVGTQATASGAYSITTSALAAGIHSITATATNTAGSISPPSGALSVNVDTASSTGDVVDVTPDPRSTSIGQITITFNEAVYGFDLADLKLTLNGGANLLTASQTLTTTNNITWTLNNLSNLTGAAGSYSLLLTATGSGITDAAGNSLTINASDSWQFVASSNSTLITAGAPWKYLDNGSNQGTAWRATGFNDTTWKSGAAQLGYGDGDEATVVSYGPDANNKYITTYFRKSFTVASAAAVTGLTMRLVRDDGVVVYLNGVEVFRNNITSGTIDYLTNASSALGAPDENAWIQANISPASLISGTNVIAVEIHQDNGASSDISFNFELVASVAQTAARPAPQPSTLIPLASVPNSSPKITVLPEGQKNSDKEMEQWLNLMWLQTRKKLQTLID